MYFKLASGQWSGEKHKAREGTVQNMRMIKKSAKKRTRLKSATSTPHNYSRYIKSIHLNVKCVCMCVSHIKNIHIARGGSEKCASGTFENDHM